MQLLVEREQGVLIQSVQRAVSLLKAFDNGTPELGVNALSRKVHLHKSTVSRLLATLEHEGLVERVPHSDKYRLSFEFVRLAGQVTHFGDVRTAARASLVKLAETSRETANLAVRDGDEVISVDQVSGPHLVRDTNWVGRSTPLNCAATGKVLLAWQPTAEIERILAAPLPRLTERTITDAHQLRADLAHVRERGYAVTLGELETGLNAIAAPIRDGTGTVVAAVSVSGPAYRVTTDRVAELGMLTRSAADEISARLGYTGS